MNYYDFTKAIYKAGFNANQVHAIIGSAMAAQQPYHNEGKDDPFIDEIAGNLYQAGFDSGDVPKAARLALEFVDYKKAG